MASAVPLIAKPDSPAGTRTFSILVENRFGVLSRIAGLFSARGYNIESLAVARTPDPTLSRITMVVRCEPLLARQILRQVEKLPNAVEVADLTDANCVERELVLVRVHAKEGKRTSLLTEAEIFRARVVTATPENYVFEVTGDSGKIEAFLDVVRPYGIDEMVRTGQVALRRNLHSRFAPETAVEETIIEAEPAATAR